MSKQETTKRDYHQEIANVFLNSVRQEKARNWEKPYFVAPQTRPHNIMTKTKYSGINLYAIAMSGFSNPQWITFKGTNDYNKIHGTSIHVIKGSKGLTTFKALVKEFTEDKNGVPLEKPYTRIFMVGNPKYPIFNAAQVNGLPPFEARQKIDFSPNFAVEQLAAALIERTGLRIEHGRTGAYFSPSENLIGMEEKVHFKSERHYYDTLAHEIIHASGLSLNRKFAGGFGTSEYAFEEMIAEFGSCFLTAELGLEHDQYSHDMHKIYLQIWDKAVSKDPMYLIQAVNAASRACNLQMEHLREYLYDLNMRHVASEEQNNLLESIGVPERILKQIQTQEAEEEHQERQEVITEPLQSPVPSSEEGLTAQTPIPVVIAPTRRQTQSRGMRM